MMLQSTILSTRKRKRSGFFKAVGTLDPGDMQVERGYSDQVHQELADMGHNVSIPHTAIGGAQAILMHDSGVLEGASDPRKDGSALGY